MPEIIPRFSLQAAAPPPTHQRVATRTPRTAQRKCLHAILHDMQKESVLQAVQKERGGQGGGDEDRGGGSEEGVFRLQEEEARGHHQHRERRAQEEAVGEDEVLRQE